MRSEGQVNRHLVAAVRGDKLLIRSQGLEAKIPITLKYNDLDVDLLKKDNHIFLVYIRIHVQLASNTNDTKNVD